LAPFMAAVAFNPSSASSGPLKPSTMTASSCSTISKPMIDDVLAKEATLKELFEAGMLAEKMAGEFYTGLADKTNDMRSKKTLLYMANMEESHYAILQAEWNQIERMNTEEANEFLDSEGLMFFGP
jgi:rubrerythrin